MQLRAGKSICIHGEVDRQWIGYRAGWAGESGPPVLEEKRNAMGLLQRIRTIGKHGPERVCFDDESITRHFGNGNTEFVRWDALESIKIATTAGGPYAEDVFWLLGAADHGCAVANGADGIADLLARMQELPGFDESAVIRAMGSTEESLFICWIRASDDNEPEHEA